MATQDRSSHQISAALILTSKPHPFYHTDIHTSHWQLRSLISSPHPNLIYYPIGTKVFVLDTKKREKRLVSKLQFTPLCLTSEGGWLCCGGHNGKYAAIKLPSPEPSFASRHIYFNLGPDSPLPLDFGIARAASLPPTDFAPAPARPELAELKFFGEELENNDPINNCISLWFPKKWISERAYQIPVAILANNDKSVYIVDLERSEQIERLTYPDCVNRAIISPDGELLVAVLDDPFLYIHKRTRREELTPGLFSSKEHYEWSPLLARIQLTGQSLTDQSSMKGSFALCFSSSGKYLAVGTQHGVISIFDVETITDEDSSPLATFTSTIPGHSSGAVRALSFCPGPFDLLAWAEAKGRVCIVDVRSNFVARQTLMIDSRVGHYEHVPISERPDDSIVDPRPTISQNDSPLDVTGASLTSVGTAPDYLGLEFERRQIRQRMMDDQSHIRQLMADRHQAPLTPDELEVLQLHRIARRARDAQANAPNASLWDLGNVGQRSSNTSNNNAADSGAGASATDRRQTSALSSLLTEYRSTASFRNFIAERNQDRERRSQERDSDARQLAERVVAERVRLGRNANATSSSSTHARRPRNEASALERLTLRTSGTDTPSNPWNEIDALYRARQPVPVSTTRLRVEYDDEDRTTITRIRTREETLRVAGMFRFRHDDEGSESPPDIMGISWSHDGRKLYVGAADGIYEFDVDITSRKLFPSIVLR